MKRVIFAFCCALVFQIFGIPCFASGFTGSIQLVKKKGGVVTTRPLPRPLNLEEDLFSAFQTPDEIIITSEAVSTTVTVNIYNAAGVVVETVTETVSAGSDFSIDLTNLPAGTYILEIAFDDTVYVGQFEL